MLSALTQTIEAFIAIPVYDQLTELFPVELEIRRTVVKRIAKTLEQKFLKEVSL